MSVEGLAPPTALAIKNRTGGTGPSPTRLHLHQPSCPCYLVYLEPPVSRYEKVRVESPQETLQTNLKHFYVKFENTKYNQKKTSPSKKNLPYPLTLR